MQINELNSYLLPYTKTIFVQDLNLKAETIKLLKENIREDLRD